jgi:YgiT-type zinc finger domain-containing protein
MERGTAPFHIDRNGYHLLFNKVAAWVCHQCGEVFFEEAEVDSIQSAIRALDVQVEKIAIPA